LAKEDLALTNQLRNRLVGGVILLALAVLFLPELLDGEKIRKEEQFATIPLRPIVEPMEVPREAFEQPIQAARLQEIPATKVKDVSESPASTPALENDSVVTQPQIKTDSGKFKKSAWAVRLGSFKNKDNVERLLKKIRDAGYRGYTVPARPVQGELTVVFAGPEIAKEKILIVQKQLADRLGLKSKLVQYDPLMM
jgi:DedD protein